MLQLTIAGNLGQASEVKNLNGKEVLSFSVAVRTGKDETQWVSVLSHQTNLAQYLTKGQKVVVSGQLRINERDGKTYLNLSASQITLMGGAGDTAPASKAPTSTPTAANDEDLPF